MKFVLPITFLVSALLTTNIEAKQHFTPGLSWDYLLGASNSVAKASNKQVVTIDLEQASGLVSYLHGKGQKVICYFSGGTMQKSRKIDYDDYVKAGVALPEVSAWGNHYIDIRKKDKLQPLIRNRMKRAKSYGCDGVKVDSIDSYRYGVGGLKQSDSVVFDKWLAETAHDEDIAVGLKNAKSIAAELQPYFDFAVVESCAESANVCNSFTPFTDHGKAVFTVHYGNRIDKLKEHGGSIESTLSKELGGHGFTCAFNDHQDLHHNSINFDCSKGNIEK
ncbi:glycoside hydrolase family 114 protein, partial [Piromyces sp. E2]